MDTTPTSTSRRRVVQGIAWAAPAVAMTAAAPAFAASTCPAQPVVKLDGGVEIDWGNSSRPYSTQQIAVGGKIDVNNLPSNVYVKKVTEQWFIENIDGQTSAGNGLWYIGNTLSNWYQEGTCDSNGCNSVQWTKSIGPATNKDYTTAPGKGDPTGVGWTSTVKNTQNNVPTPFSDQITRKAWDVTLTWEAPSPGAGISAGTTAGCNNFTTGPSGRFGVNYINGRSKAKGSTVATFPIVTVYLSDNNELKFIDKTGIIRDIK